MMKCGLLVGLLMSVMMPGVFAEEMLYAVPCQVAPHIDGIADDVAWQNAPELITHEAYADIDVRMRAVYTQDMLYVLVSFADPDESREHKTLVWNNSVGRYEDSSEREDTFVLKWNMALFPVDLSVYSGDEHTADIWFWKACRTDPAGYADDKQHLVTRYDLPGSRKIIAKNGDVCYLSRPGDEGVAAYRANIYADFQENRMQKYTVATPAGSRGDIRAKGVWNSGEWTVEFARALQTGTVDDIQFDLDGVYQCGVSRYEIAGRDIDPTLSQPLYGTGDVKQSITLSFKQ